jgi:hypothetical protein
VRTLAQLAHQYHYEAFLEALGRYATVQQESEVWFVGTFLDDIGSELARRRVERLRCCRQCGKSIRDNVRYDDRDPRADAQYCGPACRQRAYRSRVAASTQSSRAKRNGNGISSRLGRAKAAATRNGNPDARASEPMT